MAAPTPSRTALVTGANRGIGLAIARTLLDRGWTVVGTAREPDRATDLADAGARVEALDHTDPASVSDLAGRLGDTALDLLVLNAGILAEDPLEGLDPDSVLRQLDSNALGPLRVITTLLPHLQRSDEPKIAALSSVMGSIERNQEGGYYGYRASKAALNAIVRSLSQDLGFPVVAFHPGYVSTDMTRHQGHISPEESAGTLVDRFEGITPEHSGRFFDRHGEELPW